MNNISKIILFSQVAYLSLGIFCFTKAAESIKAADIVNGMVLVSLDGPYEYNSGGVPLYGYISALKVSVNPKDYNPASKTAYQASDKVQFHVCRTGKEISVSYGDLTHVKQGCGTSGRTWPETTASWPKWKVKYGKLVVVDQKGNWPEIAKRSLKDISISDLPNNYQSTLLSEQQGKTVAVTVKADDGSLLLGILPKLKTGNGS